MKNLETKNLNQIFEGKKLYGANRGILLNSEEPIPNVFTEVKHLDDLNYLWFPIVGISAEKANLLKKISKAPINSQRERTSGDLNVGCKYAFTLERKLFLIGEVLEKISFGKFNYTLIKLSEDVHAILSICSDEKKLLIESV